VRGRWLWTTAALVILWSLLIPLSPDAVRAAADPFEITIEAAPGELTQGERSLIAVSLTIAPDHYLYAHKTTVEPVPVAGLSFDEPVKPAGKEKADPFMGTVSTYEGEVVIEVPVSAGPDADPGPRRISLVVGYQGCTREICFLPARDTLTVDLEIVAAGPGMAPFFEPKTPAEPAAPRAAEPPPPDDRESSAFSRAAARFGLLGVLGAAFLWGVLASLTPCVYPMIPVTVSVIGAGSGGRPLRGFFLSVLYVLGMSLTYAALGVAAAWTGGLFGAWASHPALRIVVAALFVVLALGMFDVIYIQAPAALTSRLGGARGAGAAGAFLTGAASGAVVGPCVGPLLVAVLVYVAGLGSKLMGFLIMWTFSLGLGVLFLVVGTFSGAVAGLPRSGVWMVRLKNLFGVLLLAAALYYLQPVLSRGTYWLALGALLTGLGVFAGAFDPLPAGADGRRRLMKTAGIILVVLGAVYVARFGLGDRLQVPAGPERPTGGIVWMRNEPAALERARSLGKPVMIDFRADWCAACRRMEAETFPDPTVVRLAEGFVSLKIDSTDPSQARIRALHEKYGVVGLPTLVFLDQKGRMLTDQTVTEFIPAGELAERMRGVKAGRPGSAP
jgi:thiol:disulfide interchange protein DsbD